MGRRTSARSQDADTKAFLAAIGSHGRYDSRRVFFDVVDHLAGSIARSLPHADNDDRALRLERMLSGYGEDAQIIERGADALRAAIAKGDDSPHGPDVLGRIYMQTDAGNDAMGQFFTPYEVSRLMAQMAMPDVAELVKAKGYFTLLEPCCGSGSMILAAAEVAAQQGVDPVGSMLITARDLDRTAINMAYVQITARGLPAIVIWGDTLSDERREILMTSAFIQGGWLRRLTAVRMHPQAAPTPVTALPLQPSLFETVGQGEAA